MERSGPRWAGKRTRSGVDSSALLGALLTLASEEAPSSTREPAARKLLEQLKILAPGCARRQPYVLKALGSPAEAREALNDAIQHVALVASTGRSRFRGGHPSQAVAWCCRVLENYLVTETRWRRRQRQSKQLLEESSLPDTGSLPTGATETSNAKEPPLIQDLHGGVLAYLERTRRPNAVRSLYHAVCCYLEHVAGVPRQRQLERWAADRDSDEPRRAQNRLYQYHRRGKQVLSEFVIRSARSRRG